MRTYLCLAGAIIVAACGGSGRSDDGFASTADGGDDDGGSGGGDDDSGEVSTATPLSRDLQIDHIAMFQATAAIMMKGGSVPAPVNAPVIAGRDGLLRVYVAIGSNWQPHQVTCTLQLNTGGVDQAPIAVSLTPTVPSSDDTPESTFDFPLTAAQITGDLAYSVAIRDTTMAAQPDDSTGAWFPKDGTEQAANALENMHFKVVLVPVQYNADGSGRLPDTSATQMKLYHDTLYDVFPAEDLTITVRSQPFALSYAVGALDQNAWDNLLEDIINLRQNDGVSTDTYYLAAINPTDNVNDYFSGGGGIEGIGSVTQALDTVDRAAEVIGFAGSWGPDTATQELAHAMGRYHAPCGDPSNVDPQWPASYANASIGVWGYNVTTKQFVNPAQSMLADYMSYCTPIWTSDYTYDAIAARALFVNQHATGAVSATPKQPFHMVAVRTDGSLAWKHPMALDYTPGGERHAATYRSSTGAVVSSVTAYYFAHSGSDGGHLYVPDPPAGVATTLEIAGLPQVTTPRATLKLPK